MKIKDKNKEKKINDTYWCKTCKEGIATTGKEILIVDFLKAHKGHKIV